MAIRMSRTFVLRKLHQLSGIVPLGAFLLEHFYTNSKAVHPTDGPRAFNKAVEDLQAIPYILLVEITFIFIPLLFHAIYVVGILATIWHFANGIWLFMVDWGIAIGARAQRLTGYACIAVGFVLLAVAINALTAFVYPGGLWGGLLY
ncbi:MAG TPA: hypothetical protein VD861_06190 [Pyrinomonadaceae bacterium]|nr:hypothetical protein [Pyrinomonadaceae bacterium]